MKSPASPAAVPPSHSDSSASGATGSIASVETAARRAGGAVRGLVLVVALFLVAVGMAMVAAQWMRPKEEPWRSKALDAARQQLLTDPKNEAIKKSIRDRDLELRRAYFAALDRNRRGAWLLLVGGVALVWLSREVARLGGRSIPAPVAPALDREGFGVRTRRTVGVVAAVCGAGFLVMGLADRTYLVPVGGVGPMAAGSGSAGVGEGSAAAAGTPAAVVAPPAGPTSEQWQRNWPQFRGPDGSGRVAAANLVPNWDIASGRGVIWKAAVPMTGYNSPVVWEGRVFLTGGDKKARLVFCYDAGSGALRWQRPVTPTNAPAASIDPPDQSGAAASTVATDGQRVFAVFASGELGALDFEGNLIWHKRLDFSENGYGHASSLVVHDGRLLVQADQGQPEDGKSMLQALNTRTGEVLWTAKRPVGGSWATPLVLAAEKGAQVVTVGDPFLMAHDAVTGAEIWRAKVLGGELAPSPISHEGRVVAICPGHVMVSVKVDGTGDVTESHVAWKLEEDVPDVPTPTVVGPLLFTANTEGRLICREWETGQKIWEHNFETEFQASPLVVGDRLYLFSQPGEVFAVAVGREYREVENFKMEGEEVYATPAVAADRLYLRTKTTLYCLGAGAGPTQVADVR